MKSTNFALTAAFALAITLTFSCSGGDDGGSSGGSSSPSGGGGTNKCNSIANCKKQVIDNRTWLAENLNIDVPGSVCYDKKSANCDKYGRLYDWATAMALDASCNTSSCASQITTPHRGVCPTGWHLPSDAEWRALMQFVNPSCSATDICAGAGTKLKATSGWNSSSGIPAGRLWLFRPAGRPRHFRWQFRRCRQQRLLVECQRVR